MPKEISANKKAYHDYEILETYEAGIVLSGREIKAIRAGKVNLRGSYAKIMYLANSYQSSAISKKTDNRKLEAEGFPELYLINCHISVKDGDPTRSRKLLMHRTEISKLIGKTQQKKLTLVPLRIYLKRGLAKIALGLARGKKLYDKREEIKKKDYQRQKERGLI